MLDSFVGIINGIKAPASDEHSAVTSTPEDDSFANQSIENMYYFLEALLQLEDLHLDEESGKLVLDLYCDIVQHRVTGDGAAQSTQFSDVVRRSHLHALIERNLEPFVNTWNTAAGSDGGEAVKRFQGVVQELR